jgi:hypothetical protein
LSAVLATELALAVLAAPLSNDGSGRYGRKGAKGSRYFGSRVVSAWPLPCPKDRPRPAPLCSIEMVSDSLGLVSNYLSDNKNIICKNLYLYMYSHVEIHTYICICQILDEYRVPVEFNN